VITFFLNGIFYYIWFMKNYIGYLLLLLALVGLAFSIVFLSNWRSREEGLIGLPISLLIFFYLWKNNFFKRNS